MKSRTPHPARRLKASTETYEQQYSQDPQIHHDDLTTEVKSPEAPAGKAAITRKPVELPTADDTSLAEPLKYVVSAPEAIEKVETLLEKVKEARPDLAQEVDQVMQGVDGLEQRALGEGYEAHEAAEGQEPGQQPAAGAAPAQGQDQGGVAPGTRVKVKTQDGEHTGVVESVNEDGTLEVLTDNSMKLSRVPAEAVSAEEEGQAQAMSLPAGIKSSRRSTSVKDLENLKAAKKRASRRMRAASDPVEHGIDTAQKELGLAKDLAENARRGHKSGRPAVAKTMLETSSAAAEEAVRTLDNTGDDVKASPSKGMGAGVATGAGRKPAPVGRVKASGWTIEVENDMSGNPMGYQVLKDADMHPLKTFPSYEEAEEFVISRGGKVGMGPLLQKVTSTRKPLPEPQRKAKVQAAITKLKAKRAADPVAQQSIRAARAQFMAGTLDLRLMDAYNPAAQAEVRRLLADKTLKLAASAFDKLEKLDLGGGYIAKRGKKSDEDQAAKTVVVSDKEGKEVAEYPDAFGDDTVTIIKLLRQLHDINEADDKAAAKDEKADGGEESKKPQALPKTEKKDDEKEAKKKDDAELEAAQRGFEERLSLVRSLVSDKVSKRYVVAHQGDIDGLLLKGMGLEASMNEALKMAVDREVLRLLAMPDAELLTIRASLGGLKPRPVQVETQASNEGLTFMAGLQVFSEKVEASEGAGLGAAFGSAFRRR